jgi:hypothetical protein
MNVKYCTKLLTVVAFHTSLSFVPTDEITAKTIFEHADAGDAVAAAVIAEVRAQISMYLVKHIYCDCDWVGC